MTCARCDALEAENAWLKSRLALDGEPARLEAVRTAFRLQPQWARVLLILHTRAGRVVGRYDILDLLPPAVGNAERLEARGVYVAVQHLRTRLGDEAIRTAHCEGYVLTPAGKAKVDAALSGMAT